MPGILERWRSLFRPSIIQFSFGPDAPSQVMNISARDLYYSQANLAAVVNFLAASIAQLPLKVYRRAEDDSRIRDRTSPAARLLWSPNQDQTCFEFIRALYTEIAIFGCVYVWVIPDANSESGWQMRIIPTHWISSTEKSNSYSADKITVVSGNGESSIDIPKTEYVRFSTYSPGNPGGYVSPISALRQTLEEQIQAGRFRRELWKSSGRLNAQIIRPKDVAQWSDTTRERWIAAFREAWGAGGSKAGAIPLMEDGMEIKPFQTSFKEQQWMESVKLSREDVAAAYRINPSLVWHTDTQTYASSRDNARALYAECLGPDLQMIQQRINSFLLPMIGAEDGTYVEFDLTEKLKGSFEERANIIQSSVGAPWLTRNEARRDNNLPPIEGGDELIIPLNVASGTVTSQAETMVNAANVHSCCHHQAKSRKEVDDIEFPAGASEEEREKVGELLERFFKRQAKSIIPKVGAEARWWNDDRWNKELADDLEPVLNEIASAHGSAVAKAIGIDYFREKTIAYLRKVAEARAELINGETKNKLQQAMDEAEEDVTPEETVTQAMNKRSDVDALLLGSMLAKTVAGWGMSEASRQAEEQGVKKKVYKVWVAGANARATHASLDGEMVPIDDTFSNGADWPGDDSLSPDESCGCNCSTKIVISGG